MKNDQDVSPHHLVEAILLSTASSQTVEAIAERLPFACDIRKAIELINKDYETRSLSIIETSSGHFAVRTRPENSDLCRRTFPPPLRLSRAAQETLMVVAYFQPVTRSEIERVRGVSLGKGTLDSLIYAGFIRPGQRRMTPGNPMTFVTTQAFLEAFGFASLDDLPDMERIRDEGLIDAERGIELPGSEREDIET